MQYIQWPLFWINFFQFTAGKQRVKDGGSSCSFVEEEMKARLKAEIIAEMAAEADKKAKAEAEKAKKGAMKKAAPKK